MPRQIGSKPNTLICSNELTASCVYRNKWCINVNIYDMLYEMYVEWGLNPNTPSPIFF